MFDTFCFVMALAFHFCVLKFCHIFDSYTKDFTQNKLFGIGRKLNNNDKNRQYIFGFKGASCRFFKDVDSQDNLPQDILSLKTSLVIHIIHENMNEPN